MDGVKMFRRIVTVWKKNPDQTMLSEVVWREFPTGYESDSNWEYVECVAKSDYDTLAEQNKELQTYKTDWQSIAGKANLEHLVQENQRLREQRNVYHSICDSEGLAKKTIEQLDKEALEGGGK